MTSAFTYTHSWTLSAPPADVFRAISDPAELTRWFAEHAQVEPRRNGVYRFWGRHTLGTPPHEDARQTLTRFEPNTALAFDWPINSADSSVTMALSPHEKGTTLTLTHQVSGDLQVPRQRELIDDHWRLAMSNLSAHLAGKPAPMPDYFDPAPQVRMIVSVDAPPADVFRALIEPERINRWFGARSAVVEPRVGGRYALNWRYKVDGENVIGGPTKILELVPDEKLVLDWPDWRGDASVAGQTISFLLAPDGVRRTTLIFVHAGFGRTSDMGDYGSGWASLLELLKKESEADVAAG